MSTKAVCLRIPTVTLVLAATALPVELRPLSWATISFRFGAVDVVSNVLAYSIVGIVLAELGWVRATTIAILMSMCVETLQLVMLHRVASVADVITNLSGAIIGTTIAKRWRIGPRMLEINRWRASLAATVALALLVAMWARAGEPLNLRGVTTPGILEGHWKFDEMDGRRAEDSSGQRLHGALAGSVRRGTGMLGGAVVFDGQKGGINLGRHESFRFVGSMTISAWINSTSYPRDDAAIVSNLDDEQGYQLDTTIDLGRPRTIGFKLTDACGQLMIRYGSTPLALRTWYHIAGVYDAAKPSLDVYLNGELDNGPTLGTASTSQCSSRRPLFVGRRSDRHDWDFSGLIDDVRIYSYALTKSEIAKVMTGATLDTPSPTSTINAARREWPPGRRHGTEKPCGRISDRQDAVIPGAAASLGALVAFVCVGFRLAAGFGIPLVSGLGAGLLLLAGTWSDLPDFNLWLVPLTSMLGAASVAVSTCQTSKLARTNSNEAKSN